jgi:hypothetical protein
MSLGSRCCSFLHEYLVSLRSLILKDPLKREGLEVCHALVGLESM